MLDQPLPASPNPIKKFDFPKINDLLNFIKEESKIFDIKKEAEVKKPGFISNQKDVKNLQKDLKMNKDSVEELSAKIQQIYYRFQEN